MKKILLGILATTMASTVLAGSAHVSGSKAHYVTYANVVDIEPVYRTTKVKRYGDCREIHTNGGLETICDKVEWVSKNEHVKWYRVTYELHGETFTLREMHRPLGNKTRMTVSVTPYR